MRGLSVRDKTSSLTLSPALGSVPPGSIHAVRGHAKYDTSATQTVDKEHSRLCSFPSPLHAVSKQRENAAPGCHKPNHHHSSHTKKGSGSGSICSVPRPPGFPLCSCSTCGAPLEMLLQLGARLDSVRLSKAAQPFSFHATGKLDNIAGVGSSARGHDRQR